MTVNVFLPHADLANLTKGQVAMLLLASGVKTFKKHELPRIARKFP